MREENGQEILRIIAARKATRVRSDDISISEGRRAELRDLDKRIVDLTDPDAPEVTAWDGAERGKFYRPLKQQITLRLDKDIIAWFKAQGDKYQTRINEALREYIRQQINRA